MAGSKKKKAKRQTPAKAASTRATSKKAPKKSPKPTRKPSRAKKVIAKKGSAKKTPTRGALARKIAVTKGIVKARPPAPPATPARSPKTFAEKVRDCDAGTGVWFITAGSVEHASIQKLGSDGAVVIVTDAGVLEVVPVCNLFETADVARAARYW